jgi:hypothetical protein
MEAFVSTSEKTLEQVKSILGRLDRSIDAAREKRLHGSAVPSPATSTPPSFRDAASQQQQQIGAEAPPAPPPTSTSKFGRAQPLRLEDRSRF